MLRIHGDGPATGELGHIDVMPLALKAEVNAAVDEAFAL